MSTARTFDRRPGTVGVWSTALPALVAVAACTVSLSAVALALAGTVVSVVGVGRGLRTVHTAGAMALFAGVVAAGLSGAPAVLVVVAAGASVVAWDAGENAIGLGNQLGAAARTRRPALAHLAATAGVATVVGVVAVVTFRVANRGQPTLAVVLLLVAALLFSWLLDR